ncbi:arginine N-succinyltransferase [Vibrio casei]|uniref:Arginine N-succinyltransferase n=1 Tax=Vibrio casei TaxID=673372 RepID=A0A368LKD2_9VIBR|nr:arginine N-succinyltransferase [Vibrio casei]RCS72359.1 arginine N-succinyltransferase [Vibrio casei]SJN29512.1 Arginine N-succinyltransferase [Vibrio casei]
MLVIRPIQDTDYDALYQCAEASGHGFTSLPVNQELLSKRIEASISSFSKHTEHPQNESYLMVAVDTDTNQVVGTTGIEASIGWEVPSYSYHISKVVHSSNKLNVRNEVQVLTLGNNYTGCSEICTLFLLPEYRAGLNGRLMSKCRFLMMAQFPERFSQTVIAEMRGVSDENGNSPFWQWLQQHFFSIDFTLADYLTGTGNKGFIADLMPKLPIYVNLLSPEAQAVIGLVHQYTAPALKLLEKEGFACRGYVDIFDAGPTVECDRNHIKSIQQSFVAQVEVREHSSSHTYLISNTQLSDFRALVAKVAYDSEQNTAFIHPDVAKNLLVKSGDSIRLLLN